MCQTEGSKIESNAKASRNGKLTEEIAIRLFPDLNFLNMEYDAEFQGHPFEIKSCQLVVTDSSHTTLSRSGRFCFQSEQHQLLREQAGEYLFIVHSEGSIYVSFRIAAEKIILPFFSGVKSISWRTVVKNFLKVI